MLNEELGSQMQIYLALCDAHRIEIAENVESAMYLLRKLRPEVLLLEYDLAQLKTNGKSGLDLIKKIKKKYRDLKVVTILDSKDRNLEPAIQENGADHVLYRPIKNKQLVHDFQRLVAPVAA